MVQATVRVCGRVQTKNKKAMKQITFVFALLSDAKKFVEFLRDSTLEEVAIETKGTNYSVIYEVCELCIGADEAIEYDLEFLRDNDIEFLELHCK